MKTININGEEYATSGELGVTKTKLDRWVGLNLCQRQTINGQSYYPVAQVAKLRPQDGDRLTRAEAEIEKLRAELAAMKTSSSPAASVPAIQEWYEVITPQVEKVLADNRYITTIEAEALVGRRSNTINGWAKAGKLRSVGTGTNRQHPHRTYVHVDDVKAYAASPAAARAREKAKHLTAHREQRTFPFGS